MQVAEDGGSLPHQAGTSSQGRGSTWEGAETKGGTCRASAVMGRRGTLHLRQAHPQRGRLGHRGRQQSPGVWSLRLPRPGTQGRWVSIC